MGSGAFLVETCRQLAEALIDAWRAHGGAPPLEPDDDEVIVARRLVAQKCLYGVDRNPVAVDLAKMSLWLATLARDEPLTFIDHALRHGDSLVGLSRRQIEAFHWEGDAPDFQTGFEVMRVREHLEHISVLRRRIREADPSVPDRDVRHWWWQASREIDAVRLFGDLVVSAFFEGRKSKDRERCRTAAAALVTAGEAESRRERMEDQRRADPPLVPFHWVLEFPEVFEREASGEEDEEAPGAGNGPGFDAVVGNPPFAGKNTVAAANPVGYPDWLKALHAQSHGNADLVAHFFRRAFTLVREGGAFGLIATNTIAQGDTRSTGLRWICTHGGDVYQARRRLKWPGLAAVVVSVVHVCKGWFEGRAPSTAPRHVRGRIGSDGGPAMPGHRLVDTETGAPADQQRRPPCHAGPRRLDGVETDRITAFLCHRGGHEDPARLEANAGKSFVGSYVLGMGFTFDDTDAKGVASPLADMRRLLIETPRSGSAIFPYIGGEEVNASPTHAHHRYVINFRDYPLRREDLGESWVGADDDRCREWRRLGIVPLDYPEPVAVDWPELLAIVEQRAKPDRDVQNRKALRERWWQYAEKRPGLYAAIAGLERVLAISRVGQQAALTFLPAGMVYAETTIVFPFSDYTAFCILQSRPHETWARFFASSMKDDLRYTPSDCFETFPFPEAWATRADLEAMGRTYHEFRADLMVRRNEGLTRTYNRFHDPNENTPEVVTLRGLHAAMDRAVLDAYGWRDIPTDCEFLLDYAADQDELGSSKKPYRYRWPDAVRDEVLGRLLELNAERAAEEARVGGAAKVAEPKTKWLPNRTFARRSGSSGGPPSRVHSEEHLMNDAIIDAPAEVAAYLEQVRRLADANRDALGFLPASAYDEAAMKGCLWVAVEGTTKKLRGYLFFGDRFPRLRVYQVYVQPEFRSLGTARTLMERLKAYGEGHDYLTITARVAAELPANKFWRGLGFSVVGRYPGGKRDRTINRYALELDVPTLFGQSRPVPDSIRQPLHVRPVLETRTYVIDLNVFFDAVRDRDEGEAVDILSMAFNSDMRLVVTEEFTRELERHSNRATDASDPVLKLARALPTLPELRPDALGSLMDDLRRQLSSTGPMKTGRRAANDASDVVHLASCIYHRVYGFITRDGAILRRAEELRERYNLRIISPADLCEPLEGPGDRRERMTAMVGHEEVEIAAFDERDRREVERFLGECGVSSTDMAGCFATGTTRFPTTISVMKVGGRIVGFGSWIDIPAAGRGSVARLYVDEEFCNVDKIVDHLLEHSINRGVRGRLCRVDLKTGPGQVTIRDIATKRGFRRPDSGSGAGSGDLSKMSMMGPITESNWRVFRNSFREVTGRELPRDLPRYEELINTGVVLEAERGGRPLAVSLFDFETVISPGALISQGRIGVMVPVREAYARQLLPLPESQGSLLAKRETVLRLERAYFLAAGKHRLLPRGTIVVFYASRERREAVAMARVTFSDTLTKRQAVLKLGRQGVLTAEEIEQRASPEGEVASFTFDNLMVFEKGIPYRELKQLGCIGGANLVTAQGLPYEKLRLVVDRAVDLESS